MFKDLANWYDVNVSSGFNQLAFLIKWNHYLSFIYALETYFHRFCTSVAVQPYFS